MGNTFKLGNYVNGIFQDASNNIGIGGSPSGSYKLEVTGTAKVSSTLLLGGALTGTNASFVGTGDFSSGALTLTLGADNGLTTRTNATQKIAKIVSYNYTNANNPVGMMVANNDGTDNALWIGGGSGATIAATNIQFYTAANNNTATGTPRMTITSSGNVGIGETSPSGKLSITNDGAAVWSLYMKTPSTTTKRNSFGFFDNSSTLIAAIVTDSEADNTANLGFKTGTSNLTRMTITSGGNVGINCTPDTNSKLDVNGQAFVAHLAIYNNNGTPSLGTSPMLYSPASATLAISTGNTERMRITSGGDVLVGWTGGTFNDPAYNGVQGISLRGISGGTSIISSSTSTSMYVNRFGGGAIFASVYSPSVGTAGTTVGTISVSSTATSYNTTSDYRLKEDFKDFNGLEKIYAINVYNFKWKNSDERMDGIIAHELQEILPYAVLGEKDGQDMQGVDYSKIVPILIKGMQEQQAQIQNLQEQNQDLKSRLDKAGL